jgi:hypothetical protein
MMLCLFRMIPLPDSQIRAKTWEIGKMKGDLSQAAEALRVWLQMVQDRVELLQEERCDKWLEIVLRMLVPNSGRRIIAQQLYKEV